MRNVTRIELPETANKESFLSLLNESINKFGTNSNVQINKLNDKIVEVIGAPSLALHQFTLACESLDKSVDYEKQTIIKLN